MQRCLNVLVPIFAFCAAMPLVAQETEDTPQQAPAPAQAPSPEAEKFSQLLTEAQQLQQSNQLMAAMEKLSEAESIRKDEPIVLNMRGSLYTAMRDFDKAQAAFQKSNELAPGAFEPKFNLTELQYVQGKYPEAETGFTALLQDYPKLRVEVRHITLFKILVSRLKQGKVTEAEETMTNFTNMDDTPAYYFAKAAFAFQKEDKIEAQRWINVGGQVFKQQDNVPYLDSLIEARWIDSLGVPDSLTP